MKCPHSDCRKDFNHDWWYKELTIPWEYFVWVEQYKKDLEIASLPDFSLFSHSSGRNTTEDIEKPLNLSKNDKLKIQIFKCKHCYKYFYTIFSINFNEFGDILEESLIFEFPTSKTKFKSKEIPSEIIKYFEEAQRCRATWSLVWAWACLRKTIYTLCDLYKTDWKDYAEKIGNLPIKNEDLRAFLTHIKWLWDDLVHTIWEERYWKDEIDLIVEFLPLVIEDIYKNDEDIKTANKLLQKIASKAL